MRPTRPVPSPPRSVVLVLVCLSAICGARMSAATTGPALTLTTARASGTIFQLVAGVPTPTAFERTIDDSTCVPACLDTVPTRALFEFAWEAEPVPPATAITGYSYRLGWMGAPVSVGPDVHSVTIDTRPAGLDLNAGVTTFTLRATDDLGGVRELVRWLCLDLSPDTWLSGPDLAAFPVVPGSGGQRYIDVPDWSALPPVPGSLLSPDSLEQLPTARPERRTFFEIYGDRLWLHAEGDTVHMNSWVVVPSGGFDPDSPYAVSVNLPLLPDSLKGLPVYTPGPANGSPVGFRIRIQVKDSQGNVTNPSETTTYPVYDPTSVFHQPVVNGYWGLTVAGKAYAAVRAVDGQGIVDRRIDHQPGDAVGIADRVDACAGCGSAADQALRPKILTFHVNHDPVLEFGTPGFFPRPPQYNSGQVAGSPGRTLHLRYFASDDDPWNPFVPSPVGGPAGPPVLRYTTTVTGITDQGTEASYAAPPVVGGTSASQDIDLAVVAPEITSDDVTVHIQLCDCVQCEQFPWSGSCVEHVVPVHLNAPLDAPGSRAPVLALHGFQPNPAVGDGTIAFSLPDDRPVTLELFDTSGRRVWTTRTAPGPGPHSVRLHRSLAPGVYVVKLSHGGQVRLARAAVLR